MQYNECKNKTQYNVTMNMCIVLLLGVIAVQLMSTVQLCGNLAEKYIWFSGNNVMDCH